MHKSLVLHWSYILPLVRDNIVSLDNIQSYPIESTNRVNVLAIVTCYSWKSASRTVQRAHLNPLLLLQIKPIEMLLLHFLTFPLMTGTVSRRTLRLHRCHQARPLQPKLFLPHSFLATFPKCSLRNRISLLS